MNATVTFIQQPDEIETAWVEHSYRNDVIRRYFEAIQKRDWNDVGFVWLEAAAYDKANPGSSPITDALDEQPLANAA